MPPFATNTFDLRVAGKSQADWRETFLVNVNVEKLIDSDVLLMFEVLDFSPMLVLEKPEVLNRENLYPVAWGYLRLSGLSQYHIGESKVQMFYPVFDTKKFATTKACQTQLYNVPDVYYDFIWPNKTKYEGYLILDISPVDHPDQLRRIAKDPETVFEAEDMGPFNRGRQSAFQTVLDDNNTKGDANSEKTNRLAKILKGRYEPCRIPNNHYDKFPTGKLGCNTLAFSPNGRFLAAAVTKENSRTWIHIYDVEEKQENRLYVKLPGHKNLVHDISWSADSQFLMTSSSDMSCKLWKIPLNPYPDKSSEEILQETFIQNLFHPSFVYTGKLYQEPFRGHRFIALTGCFDGRIRAVLVPLEGKRVLEPGRVLTHPPRDQVRLLADANRGRRPGQRGTDRYETSKQHYLR